MNKTLRHWAFLIVSFVGCPLVMYAADATVIGLNNEGVIALKVSNYPLAIRKFNEALKLDPEYRLAKLNLVIAYNNYGLQLRSIPQEALKQLHQALYFDRGNPITLANVNGIIKLMGKDLSSFEDRVALGDEARQPHNADFVGAILEYWQALKLKDDPAVRAKLGDAHRALDEIDKAQGEPDRHKGLPTADQAIVDFGPYMADVRRRIKRAWFPPNGHQADRVVVVFKIQKDGAMSNLRLDHSSGVAISDQAAQEAVLHASPFRPLPLGASDDIDIQFTFDYNAFNGGGHSTIFSY